MNNIVLKVKNLTKRFPGVTALDNVSFELRYGEIHGLLGENGAGKSTLVKILYGIYTPDSGEIFIDGRKVVITSPIDALKHGLALISQNPQLIDKLTIAENLMLGLTRLGLMTPIRRIYGKLKELSEELGIEVDPNIEVWKLSYTQKQLVEILKALLLGAKVLMIDEATTFLPSNEKRRFYEFLRKFTLEGGSVILITHKIREALEVSDRITVLRLGKVVGTVRPNEVSIDEVRMMMFGERIKEISYYTEEQIKASVRDKVVLEVRDLWVLGDHGTYAVRGVSFNIHRGEILGIAGIAGNGQNELAQSIMGLRKVVRGRIVIDGHDVTNKDTVKVRELGVGYIPDSPLKHGIAPDGSIEDNIAMLPCIAKGIVRWSYVRSLAKKLISEYDIVTPSTKTPMKLLSGGNIMKVLVSRELSIAKKLLVAYNPTRALDEATAVKVRKMIKRKALEEGTAVLLISEDLDEVLQLSDYVAVMNSGKIVSLIPKERIVREEVEKLMVVK